MKSKCLVWLVLFLTAVTPAWAVEDSRNPDDWYGRAKEDLEIAEILFKETPHYGAVCFHSQQAAEKALKGALLIHGARPKKTHSTALLLKEVARFRPPVSSFESDTHFLDAVYVPSRYPRAGLPTFTRERASQCLEKAERITDALAPVHSLAS